MKKRFAAFLAAALVGTMILSGCGNKKEETKAAETAAETTAETKVDETKAAETTAGETADKVSMVVSFGTSYNDSREATIGAIETAIADAYPEYEVRRAFTSQIIIDKLKERDGLEIDNVEKALDRAAADGVKTLVVQPTHLMKDVYQRQDAYKQQVIDLILHIQNSEAKINLTIEEQPDLLNVPLYYEKNGCLLYTSSVLLIIITPRSACVRKPAAAAPMTWAYM